MEAPKEFVSRLKRDCPHLRVRWSKARNLWQIEQKTNWATQPPAYVSEIDDKMIRWRDGYSYLMEIAPGDRIPCMRCRMPVNLHHCKFKEFVCEFCKFKASQNILVERGHRFQRMVAWFPLGEPLLQHLRWSNPFTGGTERQLAELIEWERQKEATGVRERANINEAFYKEYFNYMFDIPSVGYTGKTKIIHRSDL